MALAQPPGVRSCRDGGTWDWVRVNNGVNPVLTEIESFCRGLARADAAAWKAEVAFFMEEATLGHWAFGHDRTVAFMARSRDVLELRLNDWSGGLPGKRHVRLYFTEPAGHPGLLLALKLAWKVPGPIGVEQQNEHIDEAQRRYDEWCANQ